VQQGLTNHHEPKEQRHMEASNAGREIVPAGADSSYELLQMNPDEVTALVRENLAPGETLSPRDLTRVKVPAGGATSWEVETFRGSESVKALQGVLLRIDTRRAYWPDEYSGGNDEPQCYSDDGIVGQGDPGVNCAECPFNEFESARNGLGKACKETRQLFLLPEDGILPYVITVPPASLANFKAWRMKLLGARMKPTDVECVLTLEKAENAGGIKYSRIVPVAGRTLDKAASEQLRAFAGMVAPAMDRAAKVDRSDVEGTG
jgi:hypothetical protein